MYKIIMHILIFLFPLDILPKQFGLTVSHVTLLKAVLVEVAFLTIQQLLQVDHVQITEMMLLSIAVS